MLERVFRAMGVDTQFLSFWRQFYVRQRGSTKGGLTWTRASGMLPTGVPLTTLCNTLLNVITLHYCAMKQGLIPGRDFAMVVNGDDSLVFSARFDDDRYRRDMADLGILVKAAVFVQIEKVSFCSCCFLPVTDGGQRLWIPVPHLRMFWKIGTSLFVTWRYHREYCHAVASSLSATCSPHPLNGTLCQVMERISAHKSFTQRMQRYFDTSHRLQYKYVRAATPFQKTDECYLALARRYEVEPSLIREVEKQLAEIDRPCLFGSVEVTQLARACAAIDL